MSLLDTHTLEINGRHFTVRVLPFREARSVFARLSRLLSMWGDDELKGSGVGPFVWASIGSAVTEDDLAYYCKAFGKETTVDLGDGRVVTLTVDAKGESAAMDNVFAGNLDEMFEWLDFCVRATDGKLIEKMNGALVKFSEKRSASKAEPKAE